MKFPLFRLLLLSVALETSSWAATSVTGTTVPSTCSATDPQIYIQRPASGRIILYACTSGKYQKMIQFPLLAQSETPGGTLDGTNRVFTLSHSPNPSGSVQFYVNGEIWKQGEDYTLSGNKITVKSVQTAPKSGTKLVAFYSW
jgi:hypothetical protein